jgi:hypothetical protein
VPLDRVTGEQFDVSKCGCRGRASVFDLAQAVPRTYPRANDGRNIMGAYCLLESIASHSARIGEIMEVIWFDYHGPIIFGDRKEIACIPHTGCRLEIVATPPSPHPKVDLLLPGQIIRYSHSFFFGDRFELPGGIRVGLRHLVGFKLQLASSVALPPRQDAVVRRSPAERVGACGQTAGVLVGGR